MSTDQAAPGRNAIRAVITGRVQGVGFRAWTVRTAMARGLDGWVRNRTDGTVEALFAGDGGSVDVMIADCHKGPRFASVKAIETHKADDPGRIGFSERPTV